jgi:uncharacterized protein
MQLEHSFTVPVGIDDAFAVLTDVDRVVNCMPGAALDTVDGDDFTGTVKVKLGPIGLTYKGKASLIEKDPATHRVVLRAQGRDARGNGTAAATVTAALADEGGGSTKVDVLTELDITGRPAQFGRGVMVDVGNKLIGQFADRLATTLTDGASSPAAAPESVPVAEQAPTDAAVSEPNAAEPAAVEPGADPDPTSGALSDPMSDAMSDAVAEPVGVSRRHTFRHPDDIEPIDLIKHAGPAVAKRLVPLLGVVVILAIVLRLRRR